MAISTVAGVRNGLRPPIHFLKSGASAEAAGILHSTFYEGGNPLAAAANGNALAGAALTSYAGQLPFKNPSSGYTYLARARSNIITTTTNYRTLIICDRLWHNDTIAETTTTGQTINSVTWPARDRDGSTNGVGIMVGIEVSTATTNAGVITNTTMTYTNDAGTGSKTGTIASFPATAVAGTFVPFALDAGDTGVRSIQTLTLGTSYGGGTIHLVAYRILAILNIAAPMAQVPVDMYMNQVADHDAFATGFPRLYDDTVPFMLSLPNAATSIAQVGEIVYAQG